MAASTKNDDLIFGGIVIIGVVLALDAVTGQLLANRQLYTSVMVVFLSLIGSLFVSNPKKRGNVLLIGLGVLVAMNIPAIVGFLLGMSR